MYELESKIFGTTPDGPDTIAIQGKNPNLGKGFIEGSEAPNCYLGKGKVLVMKLQYCVSHTSDSSALFLYSFEIHAP